MITADVLADSFERIRECVHALVEGLTPDDLAFRPDPEANTIAWLVWHLTRIQDDHIADAAGTGQVWTSSGWYERFGLPFDVSDTGWGHSSQQVGTLRTDAATLLGYHDATHEATRRFVKEGSATDLDRIVDERWDPPVSLGVRIVSVLADDLQHAGQAAFIRGVLERR